MTLLELLIAIVVFSVMAGIAYAGLNAMVRASEVIDQERDRVHQLQFAVSRLDEDLGQFLERAVRNEYGVSRPALLLSPGSLEITRNGWANPLGQRRPSIQRLAYQQQDDTLWRLNWVVPDRTAETAVQKVAMLEGVKMFSMQAIDQQGRFHQDWPPANFRDDNSNKIKAVALVVNLELRGIGKIRRVVLLP